MTLTDAYRRFRFVTRAGALISGIAAVGLMLLVCADVLMRNIGAGSLIGAFEVTQNYFLPLVVFPSLAWVYSSGVMPKMDLFLPKLSPGARRKTVMGLVIVEILVIATVTVSTTLWAISETASQAAFIAGKSLLPGWPVQLLVPIGFLLLLIELCFVFARNLQRVEALLTFEEETEEHAVTL